MGFDIFLSPAKSFSPINCYESCFEKTDAIFKTDANKIVEEYLSGMSCEQISALMNVSNNIAKLNYDRFSTWPNKKTCSNAIFMFNGDAYKSLDVKTLDAINIKYLQKRLKILSGLYGILKPLDEISPYRLEMGIKLQTKIGKNLYEYWYDKFSRYFALSTTKTYINLSSIEYFKSVQIHLNNNNKRVITPVFKNKSKNGEYKTIGILSKKARGSMVRFLSILQPQNIEEIKDFNLNGYKFCIKDSDENNFVFKGL